MARVESLPRRVLDRQIEQRVEGREKGQETLVEIRDLIADPGSQIGWRIQLRKLQQGSQQLNDW